MDEHHKHYEHHDDNEHHDHLESHEHHGDHTHHDHLESHEHHGDHTHHDHLESHEHHEDPKHQGHLGDYRHYESHKQVKNEEKNLFSKPILILIVLAGFLILFNQYQINEIIGLSSSGRGYNSFFGGSTDLSNIDINSLKSTGHTLAAVFPVENIQTSDDAIAIIFPTGTPEYGAELGVSFDDPVGSLDTLSKMYRGLKAETEKNNPQGFQKFMNLAKKPVGISCEYCCGLGPIGIDNNGNSACGCQHNPALLSIALYLSAYTEYNDGEILREVMRWKTLFFPKDMINLGMTVAGGDTSALANLPGMVGGC